MSPEVLIWSGEVIALFVLAGLLWRARRGPSSEERRLRDDPRFAEMWVKQYQPRGDVPAVPERDRMDRPDGVDGGAPQARRES